MAALLALLIMPSLTIIGFFQFVVAFRFGLPNKKGSAQGQIALVTSRQYKFNDP